LDGATLVVLDDRNAADEGALWFSPSGDLLPDLLSSRWLPLRPRLVSRLGIGMTLWPSRGRLAQIGITE
jgi:hypothetical protein